MFVQRFLGLPQGKHCNLLESNIWQKVISMFKKWFWIEISAFSQLFYQKWIWVMLVKGWHLFSFCLNKCEIYQLFFLHTQGLLWNWHRIMVPKFRNISYKSLRNNLIKPFQFYLCGFSLHCYFVMSNENEPVLKISSKMNPVFCDDG